jgi:hypothetical protein
VQRRYQTVGHSVGVLDVVEDVTVDDPRRRFLIGEDRDVGALSRTEFERVLDVLAGDGHGVAGNDPHVVPVRVHRVEVFCGDVDPADANTLAAADVEDDGRGILLAVERELALGVAVDVPRGDDLEVVAREAALFGSRMRRQDDDRTIETRVEDRLAVVGVIDERPRLRRREDVTVRAVRGDERLGRARHAVHVGVDPVDAVQVDRVRDRELVAVIDDDVVALVDHDHRTGDDAVIGLRHHRQARFERPGRLAGDDAEGLRRSTHRGHRGEGPVGTRHEARLARVGRRRRNRAGQGMHPRRRPSAHGRRLVGVRQCRDRNQEHHQQ